MKSAKQNFSDEDLLYHMKAVTGLLSINHVLDSKQEKYVKKVCAACSKSPLLVDLVKQLMYVSQTKNLVDIQMMLGAWKFAVGK